MRTKELIWNIFISESEDFSCPESRGAVAALGLRADRYLTRPSDLKEAICFLASTLPWPLHMYIADRIAIIPMMLLYLRMQAVADVAGRARSVLRRVLNELDEGRQPCDEDLKVLQTQIEKESPCRLEVPVNEFIERYRTDWKHLLNAIGEHRKSIDVPLSLWAKPQVWDQSSKVVSAAEYLVQKDQTAAKQVIEAIARRSKPSNKDLVLLERYLEENGMLAALKSEVSRVHAAFRRINKILAQPDETTLPGAFVAIASDSNVGDFHPPGDGQDRYLSLLEALLTRVVEASARWPGKHVLRLYVSGRDVVDPIIGGPRRIPLHIRHLGELRGRILNLVNASSVRLVPMDVEEIKDTHDPRFVLAEFLATIGQQAGGDRSLSSFERLVHVEFGILPRSGEPSRTHIQAGGSAWLVLNALKAGREPPPDKMWPWAREQAMEWAAT